MFVSVLNKLLNSNYWIIRVCFCVFYISFILFLVDVLCIFDIRPNGFLWNIYKLDFHFDMCWLYIVETWKTINCSNNYSNTMIIEWRFNTKGHRNIGLPLTHKHHVHRIWKICTHAFTYYTYLFVVFMFNCISCLLLKTSFEYDLSVYLNM